MATKGSTWKPTAALGSLPIKTQPNIHIQHRDVTLFKCTLSMKNSTATFKGKITHVYHYISNLSRSNLLIKSSTGAQ